MIYTIQSDHYQQGQYSTVMNISLSSDEILRDILLHCMVRHRNQMTQLYGCLDNKRDEIDLHTIFLRGKEIKEGLISDSFLFMQTKYIDLQFYK